MPAEKYEPQSYWSQRLASHPDLRGTGHHRYSVDYNEAMYQICAENLQAALTAAQVDLKGKTVLDIGPGMGYFVGRYIEWGASHVTGIDITQVSVQNLQRLFPAHQFIQADISDASFGFTEQYDLVSTINVVFHIVDDDRFRTALANMCRSVRPGGSLLISDAFARRSGFGTPHVHWRSLDSYMPELQKYQFEVVAMRPMKFFMGRTYLPVLGPLILYRPPFVRLMLRAERWIRRSSPPTSGYLRYMIARRSE